MASKIAACSGNLAEFDVIARFIDDSLPDPLYLRYLSFSIQKGKFTLYRGMSKKHFKERSINAIEGAALGRKAQNSWCVTLIYDPTTLSDRAATRILRIFEVVYVRFYQEDTITSIAHRFRRISVTKRDERFKGLSNFASDVKEGWGADLLYYSLSELPTEGAAEEDLAASRFRVDDGNRVIRAVFRSHNVEFENLDSVDLDRDIKFCAERGQTSFNSTAIGKRIVHYFIAPLRAFLARDLRDASPIIGFFIFIRSDRPISLFEMKVFEVSVQYISTVRYLRNRQEVLDFLHVSINASRSIAFKNTYEAKGGALIIERRKIVVLKQVVEKLLHSTLAHRGVIRVYDPLSELFYSAAELEIIGENAVECAREEIPMSDWRRSAVAYSYRCLSEGQYVYVKDRDSFVPNSLYANLEAVIWTDARTGRSLFVIPIYAGNLPVAVLSLESRFPFAFDQDIVFLKSCVRELGTFLNEVEAIRDYETLGRMSVAHVSLHNMRDAIEKVRDLDSDLGNEIRNAVAAFEISDTPPTLGQVLDRIAYRSVNGLVHPSRRRFVSEIETVLETQFDLGEVSSLVEMILENLISNRIVHEAPASPGSIAIGFQPAPELRGESTRPSEIVIVYDAGEGANIDQDQAARLTRGPLRTGERRGDGFGMAMSGAHVRLIGGHAEADIRHAVVALSSIRLRCVFRVPMLRSR